MNIFETIANLPLGVLPISLNGFGILWLTQICLNPKRRWFRYDSKNVLAVYSLSATFAIIIVYAFRIWFSPPAYYFGVNWTPAVVGLVTYMIAAVFESILAVRLGYRPVQKGMQYKLQELANSKGPGSLRSNRVRSSLFLVGMILVPTFLMPDRDVARGTYGSRALVLSLGNPDTQIGVAWLFAGLIAVFITSTVTNFTFEPVLFEKSKKCV